MPVTPLHAFMGWRGTFKTFSKTESNTCIRRRTGGYIREESGRDYVYCMTRSFMFYILYEIF
jgi:hypothetical protein